MTTTEEQTIEEQTIDSTNNINDVAENTVAENTVAETPVAENTEIKKTNPVGRIVDIEIVDENTALNMMVQFLYLGHSRGVFNLEESSKIWKCIAMFKREP
jgi:hypothetical protein